MQMRRLLAGGAARMLSPGHWGAGAGDAAPGAKGCGLRPPDGPAVLATVLAWNLTSGPRLPSSINANMQLPKPTEVPPAPLSPSRRATLAPC